MYTFDNPLRHFELDGDDINLDIGSMVSSMTYVELDDICPTRVERDGKEFAHLQRIRRYALRWLLLQITLERPSKICPAKFSSILDKSLVRKLTRRLAMGPFRKL